MKIYEITLDLKGPITQIPDSQKLFGALIYLYAQHYGDERATRFVQSVLNKEVFLALSNVLPKGYLPVPQDYLIDQIPICSGEEGTSKQMRKSIKARDYISEKDLANVLEEKIKCQNVFPYVGIAERQQLRASIDSIHYGISGLDSNLYSVPCSVILEKFSEEEKTVSEYSFYLQIKEDEAGDFMEMVRKAVDQKRLLILGKRASQGLNTFMLSGLTEKTLPGNGTKGFYLNTGMLLPDKINYQDSTLRLFTSERRPFEMKGGWDNNFVQSYISFIAEGSLIYLPEGIREAGRSIHTLDNNRIVFGNAFLHPIQLHKGGESECEN